MEEYQHTHKQLFNKVLGELLMFYFVRCGQWKHHKNKHNTKNKLLTRITEKAIITIPKENNKFINLSSYVYLYTPKELNISYYN